MFYNNQLLIYFFKDTFWYLSIKLAQTTNSISGKYTFAYPYKNDKL